MVLDGGGQLLAFQGAPLYDRALLTGVSASLSQALDSVELLHADWDEMQVQYQDGSLMIRNLRVDPNSTGRAVLAVVADMSLNRSFVTVAMRVVVQKLRQALTGSADLSQLLGSAPDATLGGAAASSPDGAYPPPHFPGVAPQPFAYSQVVGHADPRTSGYGAGLGPSANPHSGLAAPALPQQQSELSAGLSWSGVDDGKNSRVGVPVADEHAMRLLSKLAKALAPFVGPMAKVFVKEAVRNVCRDAPFCNERIGDVVKLLEAQIADPSDRQQFTSSLRTAV
jgi:hypothetical protein